MGSCTTEQENLAAARLIELQAQATVGLAQAAYDDDPSLMNGLALRQAELALETASADVAVAADALQACIEENDGDL